MKVKDSSYYKLFIFALLVVICVLLGMGIIMLSIFSTVYKNTKLEEMKTAGDLFAGCVKESYDANGYVTTEAVLNMQDQFMNEFDSDIFLYDEYGNCILAADDSSRDHLSDELKKMLDDDDYLDVYSKAYAKNQPKLLYGTMFYLKNGFIDTQKAYVLLYRSTEEISSFTVMSILVYTAFAIISIFLSYLILKRRIHKHSHFEDELMRITEKYSKGDFSESIPTNMGGRLKELADRINSLASDIESSEDTSKTFIANVSHELRTPMTTIGGFVEAILDGTIKKSQQQEYLIIVSNIVLLRGTVKVIVFVVGNVIGIIGTENKIIADSHIQVLYDFLEEGLACICLILPEGHQKAVLFTVHDLFCRKNNIRKILPRSSGESFFQKVQILLCFFLWHQRN